MLQQGVMDVLHAGEKGLWSSNAKMSLHVKSPLGLGVWGDLALSLLASSENLGGTKRGKRRHFD